MFIDVITPPSGYPIDYATVKAQIRSDDDTEETLINTYIATATDAAELETGLSFLTRTIAATYDYEESNFYRTDLYAAWGHAIFPVPLLKGPVQSITSVVDSQSNTIPSSNYQWERRGQNDFVIFTTDIQNWPITITYVTGFGTADDVPNDFINTMLAHVAHLYQNRELSDTLPAMLNAAYRKRRAGAYVG